MRFALFGAGRAGTIHARNIANREYARSRIPGEHLSAYPAIGAIF